MKTPINLFHKQELDLILDSEDTDALITLFSKCHIRYQYWCQRNKTRLGEVFASQNRNHVYAVHYIPENHKYLVLGRVYKERFYRLRWVLSHHSFQLDKKLPLKQLHRRYKNAQFFIYLKENQIDDFIKGFRLKRNINFLMLEE